MYKYRIVDARGDTIVERHYKTASIKMKNKSHYKRIINTKPIKEIKCQQQKTT